MSLRLHRKSGVKSLSSGLGVSAVGDGMLFVALPAWVFFTTQSPISTALTFFAQTLPKLLLGPLAGVLVDWWDRKRILIAADLLRAVIVLGLFLVTDGVYLWILYLIVTLESIISTLARPAAAALIPYLVDNDATSLNRANSLLYTGLSIGQIAGPPLGGWLIMSAGLGVTSLIDAFTYVISAYLMFQITPYRPISSDRQTAMPIKVSQKLIQIS